MLKSSVHEKSLACFEVSWPFFGRIQIHRLILEKPLWWVRLVGYMATMNNLETLRSISLRCSIRLKDFDALSTGSQPSDLLLYTLLLEYSDQIFLAFSEVTPGLIVHRY